MPTTIGYNLEMPQNLINLLSHAIQSSDYTKTKFDEIINAIKSLPHENLVDHPDEKKLAQKLLEYGRLLLGNIDLTKVEEFDPEKLGLSDLPKIFQHSISLCAKYNSGYKEFAKCLIAYRHEHFLIQVLNSHTVQMNVTDGKEKHVDLMIDAIGKTLKIMRNNKQVFRLFLNTFKENIWKLFTNAQKEKLFEIAEILIKESQRDDKELVEYKGQLIKAVIENVKNPLKKVQGEMNFTYNRFKLLNFEVNLKTLQQIENQLIMLSFNPLTTRFDDHFLGSGFIELKKAYSTALKSHSISEKDKNDIRKKYQKASDLAEKHGKNSAVVQAELGEPFYEKQNYKAALKYYERCVLLYEAKFSPEQLAKYAASNKKDSKSSSVIQNEFDDLEYPYDEEYQHVLEIASECVYYIYHEHKLGGSSDDLIEMWMKRCELYSAKLNAYKISYGIDVAEEVLSDAPTEVEEEAVAVNIASAAEIENAANAVENANATNAAENTGAASSTYNTSASSSASGENSIQDDDALHEEQDVQMIDSGAAAASATMGVQRVKRKATVEDDFDEKLNDRRARLLEHDAWRKATSANLHSLFGTVGATVNASSNNLACAFDTKAAASGNLKFIINPKTMTLHSNSHAAKIEKEVLSQHGLQQ